MTETRQWRPDSVDEGTLCYRDLPPPHYDARLYIVLLYKGGGLKAGSSCGGVSNYVFAMLRKEEEYEIRVIRDYGTAQGGLQRSLSARNLPIGLPVSSRKSTISFARERGVTLCKSASCDQETLCSMNGSLR